MKNKINWVCLCLTVLFLAVLTFAMPPASNGIKIAYFTHNQKDILGNDEVLTRAEYVLLVNGEDANVAIPETARRFTVDLATDWKTSMTSLLVNQPQSLQTEVLSSFRADQIDPLFLDITPNNYRIWVSVSDDWGNWSNYSESINIIDLVPPGQSNKPGCAIIKK